jgi:hypothetical protein
MKATGCSHQFRRHVCRLARGEMRSKELTYLFLNSMHRGFTTLPNVVAAVVVDSGHASSSTEKLVPLFKETLDCPSRKGQTQTSAR